MKRKIYILLSIVIIGFILSLWLKAPKEINMSKVINLTQSNYKSITIRDKVIKSGTKNQYLIDDFIPKLARYTIKRSKDDMVYTPTYKVEIVDNNNLKIILLDNRYIVINDITYIIMDGNINLDKFYNIFME